MGVIRMTYVRCTAFICCKVETFGRPLGTRAGQAAWLNLQEIQRHFLGSSRRS
jgi:hypothetical protein